MPSYLQTIKRGESMCNTIKTDIALLAAALTAAVTVLGADLSLADIASVLSIVN